jgi:hypothetical protein
MASPFPKNLPFWAYIQVPKKAPEKCWAVADFFPCKMTSAGRKWNLQHKEAIH